jgi:hypothetical protein
VGTEVKETTKGRKTYNAKFICASFTESHNYNVRERKSLYRARGIAVCILVDMASMFSTPRVLVSVKVT